MKLNRCLYRILKQLTFDFPEEGWDMLIIKWKLQQNSVSFLLSHVIASERKNKHNNNKNQTNKIDRNKDRRGGGGGGGERQTKRNTEANKKN